MMPLPILLLMVLLIWLSLLLLTLPLLMLLPLILLPVVLLLLIIYLLLGKAKSEGAASLILLLCSGRGGSLHGRKKGIFVLVRHTISLKEEIIVWRDVRVVVIWHGKGGSECKER